MTISLSIITGVMAGFEIVEDEEEGVTFYVLDLFLIRLLLCTGGQ